MAVTRRLALAGLFLFCMATLAAPARADTPDGLTLELELDRPDTLQLRILGPDPRSLPDPDRLRQCLAEVGMGIPEVRQPDTLKILATLHPAPATGGVGALTLDPVGQCVRDSAGAPVQEWRVVAPRFLALTWSGAVPSDVQSDSLPNASYLFRPAPASQVQVRFAPRPDLPARALQAGLWALLPLITGTVLSWMVVRRSSEGRLPFAVNLVPGAVLFAAMPFQFHYTRWLAGWVQWQFRSPVVAGLAGFSPLALVFLTGAAPVFVVAWRFSQRSPRPH